MERQLAAARRSPGTRAQGPPLRQSSPATVAQAAFDQILHQPLGLYDAIDLLARIRRLEQAAIGAALGPFRRILDSRPQSERLSPLWRCVRSNREAIRRRRQRRRSEARSAASPATSFRNAIYRSSASCLISLFNAPACLRTRGATSLRRNCCFISAARAQTVHADRDGSMISVNCRRCSARIVISDLEYSQ